MTLNDLERRNSPYFCVLSRNSTDFQVEIGLTNCAKIIGGGGRPLVNAPLIRLRRMALYKSVLID